MPKRFLPKKPLSRTPYSHPTWRDLATWDPDEDNIWEHHPHHRIYAGITTIVFLSLLIGVIWAVGGLEVLPP